MIYRCNVCSEYLGETDKFELWDNHRYCHPSVRGCLEFKKKAKRWTLTQAEITAMWADLADAVWHDDE